MADYDYDVIIVGCGVGGHGAALHARGQVCCSVCCSVVQCVAACVAVPWSRPPCSRASVLQRAALCVAEPPSMRAGRQSGAVCCSALQCHGAALLARGHVCCCVCYSVVQCVAVCVAVPPSTRAARCVAVCVAMPWSRPPCVRIGVLQRVLHFVFQCFVPLCPLTLDACARTGSENCHFHGR